MRKSADSAMAILFDNNGAPINRGIESTNCFPAPTMAQAVRDAIVQGKCAIERGAATRAIVRDALGGLRAEMWRDASGTIQTRKTK